MKEEQRVQLACSPYSGGRMKKPITIEVFGDVRRLQVAFTNTHGSVVVIDVARRWGAAELAAQLRAAADKIEAVAAKGESYDVA